MATKGQTVTRYSRNPLAKKFKCPQCDEWFRSLQGLSGHVHFKHGIQEKKQDIIDQLVEVGKREVNLVAYCKAGGLSKEATKARVQVLRRWRDLVTYCDSFGITLGFSDFKKFIIESFGNASQSEG